MANKQPMMAYGSLVNPENGHILSNVEVDAYNRYSEDINEMSRIDRTDAVETLKDHRFQYLVLCGTEGYIGWR